MKTRLLFFLMLFPFVQLSSQNGEIVHSVFLIGDAGEPYENPVLELLKTELQKVGNKGSVVFLGDNIYPKGMPPKGHPLRAEAEIAINGQIDAVRGFSGNTIFVPGNHDWKQGADEGLDWLNLQEQYVEAALDSTDVWLPSKGCPGPVEVPIHDNITLIIVDTQWFLHRGIKPDNEDCNATSAAEIADALKDALLRNANKKVIVASHHPMYTYGIHGGVFSAKDHLFPLTASKSMENLYIPLPGLGSIYPLYRKIFGNIQDTSHPIYKRFSQSMVTLMQQHPDLVHVAGHEHALEHIKKDGVNYIVSGSGSKNNAHVKQKGDALYADNTMGFARLDYYANGKTELTFFTPENNSPKTLYSASVSEKPFPPVPKDLMAEYANISFAGRDTIFAASNKYNGRSKLHQAVFGENYREEWATKIKVPMFDIATVKGGLKIIKKGGGHQTLSLRLEAEDGKQYVIRSMDKNPALTLPPELRRTIVKAIVQDGISASHPYAPMVIPPLAEAADIFHANPKVYYVPDDPRLGIYREDFANTLVLFEERANKEQVRQQAFFGKGEDDLSSIDLYEELRDDNDNHVDQTFVVRNRLFDMWLGDWDRHDDQWRWVEYDLPDDEKLYKPIPRDRDVVFFAGEGAFKKVAASKWAQPSLKGFHDEISYTPSYGFYRIRWFDRYFMTEPSEADWVKQANELKAALTDEVIEQAFENWPEEIYDLHGDEIIRKLKNRRDLLDVYAADYYKFLSKDVTILGSDKRELFNVERLNDDETKVTVYKISKKDNRDKVLYERTFKTAETKEIRLFGFDGEDEFEVSGDVSKGIIVRIIGGEDKDLIVDKSAVSGLKKNTVVYDTKSSTILDTSKETKDKTSDKDPNINRYNMQEYDFDVLMPLVAANYNPDDGIFIGGGFMLKKDGFRKEPYASKQSFTGVYAFATSSFGLFYNGDFKKAIGNVDLLLKAEVRSPNFVNNFFGLGNESDYNEELGLNYYRTRYQSYLLSPSLVFNLSPNIELRLGTSFLDVQIEEEENEGRFITDFPNNGLAPDGLFEHKRYLGSSIGFHIDNTDNEVQARSGVTFNTEFRYNNGINEFADNSGKFLTNVTFRWTPGIAQRTTIATRVGYEKSLGDYEFFQASQLDGFNTLRGYRRYRFAGESSFYQQLDVRVELFHWQNYILPSTVGLVFFNDIGRVWYDGEDSNTLHHGYGGGVYFTPLGRVAINLLLANSKENLLPLVKLGFYF
ncbi:metallophosphoesterase [Roseivirga pacifica]|uniref:metallophosphoesterase n=1 Tax=Roseivirga pacifica TaxID=1267423 RepID=UPI003BB14B8D